jgi:SAM-dependent methyltransferase
VSSRVVGSEWLVEHGAEVLGLDVSPKIVEHARARVRGRAAIRQADLGRPLDFLPAASFDLIVSALTLDNMRDWDRLFAEFYRILRSPGHVVFSAGHPFDEFYRHHPEGNYFETERVEWTYDWKEFGVKETTPFYRRPLGAMIAPSRGPAFVSSGCWSRYR